MLTDTALRNLKPKSLIYKVSDRDGMYVTVSTAGTVTFRYDYRLNGRRETLTIGRYGPTGISLALAREKLLDAKKAVAEGKSPAHEKQREKRRLTAAKDFGDMTVRWLADGKMADSTRAMRKSIVDRDILPAFKNRRLNEISSDDLRALCNKVKARGAPATAVHVRDIVKQAYAFAILHGEKVDNPADGVGAASIATFVPKDRALSPMEIRLMYRQMESVATYPTIRLALRMILLTLVRKSELIEATRHWRSTRHGAAIRRVPRHPHVQTGFSRNAVPRPFILPCIFPWPDGTGMRCPGGAAQGAAGRPANARHAAGVERSGQAVCTGECTAQRSRG